MDVLKYVINACLQFLSIQLEFGGYHFSLLSIFILVCIASALAYLLHSLT